MDIKRYDIFFADLNPTEGRELNKIRPVVVVSPDGMNKYTDLVIVCPITSSIHPTWRSRIKIKCDGNDGEIAVEQIRSISKLRLKKKIDKLDRNSAEVLREKLRELLTV